MNQWKEDLWFYQYTSKDLNHENFSKQDFYVSVENAVLCLCNGDLHGWTAWIDLHLDE